MTEPEILSGYKMIARFIGLTPRQVAHMAKENRLPVFHIRGSRNVFARPATLRKWLAEAEEKAER